MEPKIWIAPPDTKPASAWKEIGYISEDALNITPTEPPEPDYYATRRTWSAHIRLHFQNTLTFRNYYRVITGTSQGLTPLIHNGKKPRK